MAAEYIISSGNPNIILCERGIRTFETTTRNTIDISAIPVVKELSHLPIIVDPSHATGTWKYVDSSSESGGGRGGRTVYSLKYTMTRPGPYAMGPNPSVRINLPSWLKS